MDRAIGRGPAWIWPALMLGLGAVAAGVGCGVATEPAPPSSGLSPRYAVACEGDASDCDGGTDGGRDGGPDSGHDGGHDGGTDGGHDGGTDGGHDGGHDGGQDGGPDGGHDGGTDGGCDAAAMQAAAPRGEAVDPGACKWNIPPDTRNVVPINKIYDVGPANLIVKSQEAQTTDYEICSVDNKKTSSGSIQGCWRYAANLMGACVAGSGGSTTEDGTCQTPFCPCDGADGECREPSCTMHKDNKQYGFGGGINLGLYQSKNIPLIGRFIPWSQGFNVNANVIIQGGYGFGQDDRNGSGSCFNCCPNGNPKRDDIQHINAELKGTVFVTGRIWNLCATLTANAAGCYQHDFINRLDCNGTKQFVNDDRGFFYASLGNFYLGVCLGEKDKKAQARGGICSYDAATETAQCGWGWFSKSVQIPNYLSRSINGGTAAICLF